MLRLVAAAVRQPPPPPPRGRALRLQCTRCLCAVVKAVDATAAREFWEHKGTLTERDVARLLAFAAARPILQRPAELQTKLDGLRDVLGLDEPAVVRMAAIHPHLLSLAAPTKDRPSVLASNFCALQAQFALFDVLKMVQQHPQLLVLPRATVERKLSAFAEALPGVDVMLLVSRFPRLLNSNANTVRKNVEGLMRQFSRSDAMRMLVHQPSVLCGDFDATVAPNFDRFRDVFGIECARRVSRTQPQLLRLDFHRTVLPKISELATALQCSEPEAKELMTRVPLLFTRKVSSLSSNVEALVQMLRQLGSDTPKEDVNDIVHRHPMAITYRPCMMAHRVERVVALAGSKERARDMILACPQLLWIGLGVLNRVAFVHASGSRKLGASTVAKIPAAALAKKLPGYHDFLVARANTQWLDWHTQLREDERFRAGFAKRLLSTNAQPTPSEIATALDALPQAFARLKLRDLEQTVGDMEVLRANAKAPTTAGLGK